jgi:hypothetical protein
MNPFTDWLPPKLLRGIAGRQTPVYASFAAAPS